MSALEYFLKDVEKFEMETLMDVGIHRNLVFRDPKDSNRWFGLNTWPGHLCFYGDMGTFVFYRINDMFQFFTSKSLEQVEDVLAYWGEKVESGEVKEYSANKAASCVTNYLSDEDNYCHLEKVKEDLIPLFTEMGAEGAFNKVYNYQFNDDTGFEDVSEWFDPMVYTPRFVWACHAISWGVQKYSSQT